MKTIPIGRQLLATAALATLAGPAQAAVSEPCELTEPEVVSSIFGQPVPGEQAGPARNCEYTLADPASGLTVNVFYYGTGAEWDGIKQGYEQNRGPLTEREGLGDDAYSPGDAPETEIVVLVGDVAFAVQYVAVLQEPPADIGAKLLALATQIAGEQG